MNKQGKTQSNPIFYHFCRFLIVPLIGSMVLAYFTCPTCLSEARYDHYLANVLFSFSLWNSIGYGNYYLIIKPLDKYLSWMDQPILKAIIALVISVTYVTVAVFTIHYSLYEWYLEKDFMKALFSGGVIFSIGISITIAMMISLFFHARAFFFSWRETAVQVEKLKNENLSSRLESLKNQVNPHFLFNSLNTLATLVEDKSEVSVDFIHELSGVYRYVLQQHENELVPLSDEFEFVKSYVVLHNIRFDENFEVCFEGDQDIREDEFVPPLALQTLLENCIKHNEISIEKKLKIQIEKRKDSIKVSNNVNPLKVEKRDSTQVGIKNLTLRYSYVTKREIIIHHDADRFEIEIPVLKLT